MLYPFNELKLVEVEMLWSYKQQHGLQKLHLDIIILNLYKLLQEDNNHNKVFLNGGFRDF